MRRLWILGSIVVLLLAAWTSTAVGSQSRASAESLSGAGSSFIFPLVSQWIPAYESAAGTKVSYNPVGSGAGIQAISNRQVDFGTTDAPLSPDQFSSCKGCVQIPWVLSATSVPYNVDNAPYGLKITGKLLADIYLGKVKKWNDPRIARLNKGRNLPDLGITPIYRSDSSGTTYNFTEYLSKVSKEWRDKVGKGTQVNFPTGIGAARSSGVAGALSRTNGGITYVDVAYSLKNKFKLFKIRNKAGLFALPGIRGIQAAAATIRRVPANNEISIVDPPKSQKSAYPICTFSYVVVPLQTSKAADLRRFIGWALTKGQTYGPQLLFVRIPAVVRNKSQKTLKRVHS